MRGTLGTQGPQGAPGSRGAQGPRGMAAAASVSSVTATIDRLAVGLQSVTASCPAGTTAASGGYSFTGIGPSSIPSVGSDAPVGGSATTGPTAWTIAFPVSASLKDIQGATVTVYADCS
jgi:hypothetical protein